MKATKRIGVWMDYSVARLIEFTSNQNFKVTVVESNATGLDTQEGLQHSENVLNNKISRTLSAYYKELIELVKNYDEIVLFGPTKAKLELYNMIREDHKYDHLKIETKSADKMSYQEQHEFIQEYFSKLLNYESSYNK